MRRIAVFVEGQTELILIREMLLKVFNWNVDIVCLQLIGNEFRSAEYLHKCPSADIHYQLINVGNDRRVLTIALSRESSLINAGFERIVCSRDMYSREYRDREATINRQVIEDFLRAANEEILKKSIHPENIFFSYAIMETEAWFLGIENLMERMDAALTNDNIRDNCGIDLCAIDPENVIFHPAGFLSAIYSLIGNTYDKKRSQIEALVSNIKLEDYTILYKKAICASFNKLYDSLIRLN